MSEMARVNWVNCPKCQFRYYVGPQLLLVEGLPSICPKCRHEFDPKKHLEATLTGLNVSDRWY